MESQQDDGVKSWAVDVSKTASASEIVFEALRKAIIEGGIPIGAPLRQDEIARQFNTSRIPVREAISRLEELGLVTSRRYKGAVVSGLSTDEAAQIFEFRALVEPEIIRDSVSKLSADLLTEARGHCEAFFASRDPMRWGALNRLFHATLYRASGLAYHRQTVERAMDRIDAFLRAQILLSDGMDRANHEHQAILDACIARDADAAARLTKEHIEGAKLSLLEGLDALQNS